MKLFLCIFYLLYGYIPPTEFVLKKTVENFGKGPYQIEQEVTFISNTGNPILLKEVWKIENENIMLLKVYAPREFSKEYGIRDSVKDSAKDSSRDSKEKPIAVRYYLQGKKWYFSLKGKESETQSTDFIERYNQFRSSDAFMRALLQLKIISDVKASAPPPRLSRIGGGVSYFIGVPSEAFSKNSPGLWIEQDRFILNKIRLPNEVEITYSQYNSLSKGLMFPWKREVRWENNLVEIKTLKVYPIKSFRDELNPKILTLPESLHRLDGSYSETQRRGVEEFYLRFR